VLDDAPVDLVALERDQQLEPVEVIDLDQAVISANALASPGEPGPVPAI
jgi:hypothetical protein